MEYCKFIDGLPRIAKILIAIFLNVLFLIYRIIADVLANKSGLLLWDILFGFVISVVFWVMNLISIITTGEVFSFSAWFGENGGISTSEK